MEGILSLKLFWEDHEQCLEVIRANWAKGFSDEGVWQNLPKKTKACKKELAAWNQSTFKNAAKEIDKFKRSLTKLLNKDVEEVDWE